MVLGVSEACNGHELCVYSSVVVAIIYMCFHAALDSVGNLTVYSPISQDMAWRPSI